jgi:hypothetical protein
MEECLRRGQDLGIGQFPVMEDGKVVGVISSKEIFSLAAHFLGAWEKRCGITLGPLEIKPGTIGRIADLVEGAGAEVQAIYPITRGEDGGNGQPRERKVIVRFHAAELKKVVAVLEAAGFRVIESVDTTAKTSIEPQETSQANGPEIFHQPVRRRQRTEARQGGSRLEPGDFPRLQADRGEEGPGAAVRERQGLRRRCSPAPSPPPSASPSCWASRTTCRCASRRRPG